MYNVNQILDRTFDNWSTMLGANEFSFWAVSVVEMKPTGKKPTGNSRFTYNWKKPDSPKQQALAESTSNLPNGWKISRGLG